MAPTGPVASVARLLEAPPATLHGRRVAAASIKPRVGRPASLLLATEGQAILELNPHLYRVQMHDQLVLRLLEEGQWPLD